MPWTWIIGLAGGIGIPMFTPSLKSKSIATRIGIGVVAGGGLAIVTNACLEVRSHLWAGRSELH
jgi:hypothetical protein